MGISGRKKNARMFGVTCQHQQSVLYVNQSAASYFGNTVMYMQNRKRTDEPVVVVGLNLNPTIGNGQVPPNNT